MKQLILFFIIILFSAAHAPAQELDNLKDLKRPRYEAFFPDRPKPEENQQTPNSAKANESIAIKDSSRFAGVFRGKVTVHYKGQMVNTEATLHIFPGGNEKDSHFNSYILPVDKDYLETTWKSENKNVRRSVTISGNTIYITDLIAYKHGGNSQIRTLVFSPDYSALTFLKTEFDDDNRDPATGQIIGRFVRIQ
ncbi:MAG TPA: hypothetical protein DCS48_08680 [Desulfovibrio sp.]|nr:hypothetical protein [Desulfovibrio sp.]